MTKNDKLVVAVKLVNDAISSDVKRLKTIASGSEQDPIIIEGETDTGYYCQMMVNSKEVAQSSCVMIIQLGKF